MACPLVLLSRLVIIHNVKWKLCREGCCLSCLPQQFFLQNIGIACRRRRRSFLHAATVAGRHISPSQAGFNVISKHKVRE